MIDFDDLSQSSEILQFENEEADTDTILKLREFYSYIIKDAALGCVWYRRAADEYCFKGACEAVCDAYNKAFKV